MTTMEDLVAGIGADARQEADRIESETHSELSRIDAETELLVAAKRERLDNEARREEEELQRRIDAKLQLEARQQTLACKQELLDQAFKAARDALEDANLRRRILQRLWENAGRQMRIARVTTAKRDAQFFKGKEGRGIGVRTDDKVDGGFIAESSDGKVSIDMRFGTLLDDIRQRKTAEVSAVLFGTGTSDTARTNAARSDKLRRRAR